ncbi:MAG: TauD/TfdA family dioxygenase [Rhodospirillales bacterium]|nr:MAG: TauD/TfdA family dioxygenase [Rhodospirillales bacterium]
MRDEGRTVVQSGGPFDLADADAYRRWRDRKLASRVADPAELLVELSLLAAPTEAERAAILALCRRANMAIYAGPVLEPTAAKKAVAALGAALGLHRLDRNLCAEEDGISALEVRAGSGAGEYVPYTDRSLSWHTDGYYNSDAEQVRGVILHCVRAASDGGGNALMDPEIAYIRLRDEDPAFIAALMHPEAMTIPANTLSGTEIRPARIGPVFSVDPASGALHMRYSARKVNVVWRDDAVTRAAVDFLNALLVADGPDIHHWRLRPGEGYISNNVLHNRTAFEDAPRPDAGRLVYRARYFDRIEGTEPCR